MSEPAEAKQAFAQAQELMGMKPEQSDAEKQKVLMERLINSQASVIDNQRTRIEELRAEVKRLSPNQHSRVPDESSTAVHRAMYREQGTTP